MSRARRWTRVAVAGLTAVLAASLAACGDSGADRVNYLIDAGVGNYNVNTVAGYASGAVMALARVQPGFSYLGPDGQVVPDHDIGSVTVEEGPSLTLRYTFAKDSVYSDGTQMTCDDIALAAAAMGGKLRGFDAATHAGYRDIARVDCTPGEKTALVTFARGRDYAQWPALFGVGALLPSHVVARMAGEDDLVGALDSRDQDRIGKIATAWNTGFTLTPGQEINQDDFVSAGPYRVARYTVDGGLELTANDKWWAQAPVTKNVTVWPRGTDAGKAVDEGRIDVADTADLSVGDRVAGRATAELDGSENRTAEQDPRPLSVTELVPAARGVMADPLVRRAFASCVPRDRLAQRFGANGLVWSLRTVAPADSLSGALNEQFARRYPRADVRRARTLLAQRPTDENGRRPKVNIRLGYVGPDPVAAAVVADISGSCSAANITVTDAASPEVTPGDLGRSVDVLLTNGPTGSAAAGTASGFPDAFALFRGDPLNLSGFDDARAAGAINDLSLTDVGSTRLPLIRTVETAAWDRLASIPLYGTVRAREHTPQVARVVPGLARTGTGWNMDRWELT
ncbi:ABC transporter substrate-binding protein [Gordonia alkaliphila]|uniref:ABC transporter substrate-binding protein n=1 Tax=Gordonia alkaliphila TaxID=1053547 RepID=A0ABP8YX26_9ACTN